MAIISIIVNCSLTIWSNWSNCTAGTDCGTGKGTQSRVRRVERGAQHGGWDCQGELEETRTCILELEDCRSAAGTVVAVLFVLLLVLAAVAAALYKFRSQLPADLRRSVEQGGAELVDRLTSVKLPGFLTGQADSETWLETDHIVLRKEEDGRKFKDCVKAVVHDEAGITEEFRKLDTDTRQLELKPEFERGGEHNRYYDIGAEIFFLL